MRLPYKFNLWARYQDSKLPLRLNVIKLALMLDGDDDFERLMFMTEQRYFQYCCDREEMLGKIEGIRDIAIHADVMSKQGDGTTTYKELSEFCWSWANSLEEVLKRFRQSYLAKDNRLFYWGKD